MVEHLSDDQYIQGLHGADTGVVERIYSDFRPAIIRAIAARGGSEASGKVFFRAGLVDIARPNEAGSALAGQPFADRLQSLALAHYRDWLAERGQPVPETSGEPETPENAAELPASDQLRETRALIEAWKKGEQTEDPLYALWRAMWKAENGPAPTEAARPQNKIIRYVAAAVLLLIVGWLIWIFAFRSKTPAEVYNDNFTMPESLMADAAARYAAARGNDSVSVRPNRCEFLLREADEFYKVKDHESAMALLFEVLDDSLTACHSDALYYIGIIALEKGEPELTLECFSKIEDLEHFGEDLYWYQALAFVKLAEKNPLLRDKAARAVERARSNAQDSLRRQQAEKMLEHLAE